MVELVGLWVQRRKHPDISHWTMVPFQASWSLKSLQIILAIFCPLHSASQFPSLLCKWPKRSWGENVNLINGSCKEGLSISLPQNSRAYFLCTDGKDESMLNLPWGPLLRVVLTHASNIFLGAFYVFYLTIKDKSSDLGSIIPIVIDEEMGPREVK